MIATKLLTYALGRAVDYYDMPAKSARLKAECRRTNDYRFFVARNGRRREKYGDFQMPARTGGTGEGLNSVMPGITKKHLPRRTFLRNVLGALVALPLLDSG